MVEWHRSQLSHVVHGKDWGGQNWGGGVRMGEGVVIEWGGGGRIGEGWWQNVG